MVRDYVLVAVLAALMSTFAVVRHSRQGEETGRAELVGAAVVGRGAGLAAALVVTVAANAVLALALAFALVIAGQPAAGSLAAGAAVAAVGVAFAGVAAITSQLATSTRGASGLSAAVLGSAFLCAGVGNAAGSVDASGTGVTSAWPAWLSPIGWGQQMRPFGGDNWWPLVAVVLFFAGTPTRTGGRRRWSCSTGWCRYGWHRPRTLERCTMPGRTGPRATRRRALQRCPDGAAADGRYARRCR